MKKELSELERKRLLKKHHHQKIDYALAKAFINDSDVYRLVKDFFAEYLGLDYEFTHEELNSELNKKFIDEDLKVEISQFLGKLSHVQFNADKKPTQEQLRSLITQFKTIVERLIVFEEQNSQGILAKIKQFIQRKFPAKHASDKNLLGVISQEKKESDTVLNKLQKEIEQSAVAVTPSALMQDIDKHLSTGNIMNAKETYKRLLRMYNDLPEKQKHQYFPKINEYYRKLTG